MWDTHIAKQKAPEARFYFPAPGQYEFKNYCKEDPSFGAPKFQTTVRPLNQVSMADQKELIEFMQAKRTVSKKQTVSPFKGYESSMGMSVLRTSDIGRRLHYDAHTDEKGLPFA